MSSSITVFLDIAKYRWKIANLYTPNGAAVGVRELESLGYRVAYSAVSIQYRCVTNRPMDMQTGSAPVYHASIALRGKK